MNMLLVAAALGATALGGAALSAQTTTPPAPSARADADGDGIVSRSEFVTRAGARFDRLDIDRNGQLTREERRSVRQAGGGRAHDRMGDRRGGRGGERMLARLDADKDGRISRDEFGAAAGLMTQRAGASDDVAGRVAARFTRLDANKDGYIDAAERSAKPRRCHHKARGGA